jgi:hypothetical protein
MVCDRLEVIGNLFPPLVYTNRGHRGPPTSHPTSHLGQRHADRIFPCESLLGPICHLLMPNLAPPTSHPENRLGQMYADRAFPSGPLFGQSDNLLMPDRAAPLPTLPPAQWSLGKVTLGPNADGLRPTRGHRAYPSPPHLLRSLLRWPHPQRLFNALQLLDCPDGPGIQQLLIF